MAKVSAVVPAAGQGTRMGARGKKQFLALDGIPVVGHVLRVLDTCRIIQNIVLVVGSGEEEQCRSEIIDRFGIQKAVAIVTGGKERQDSVYSGLLALSSDTGTVVVHDGARPLLNLDSLEKVVEAAEIHGAATCAVPVKDTVKMAGEDGLVTATLPRDRLWLTQTPQAFHYQVIMEAHRKAREENFTGTDDAGLVEFLGLPVKLVPGAYENIKITTPEDMIIAVALLKASRH